jgi:ribose 5-phosphate isomerase B
MTRMVVSCDHRGIETVRRIISWCEKKGIEAVDLGPQSSDSVDYPDYAFPLVERVLASGGEEVGVLVCGWGNGMAIAANKVKGARAALCMDRVQTEYARGHNNANILILSAEDTGWGMMQEILDAFLATEFDGGRHTRRLDKIAEYESRE